LRVNRKQRSIQRNPVEVQSDIPTKILTPDVVEIRIGELDFYDGMPTKETFDKVYDNPDFMRGVEVFLNFIPATSIEGLRQGMKELGVDDYNQRRVCRNQGLTARPRRGRCLFEKV